MRIFCTILLLFFSSVIVHAQSVIDSSGLQHKHSLIHLPPLPKHKIIHEQDSISKTRVVQHRRYVRELDRINDSIRFYQYLEHKSNTNIVYKLVYNALVVNSPQEDFDATPEETADLREQFEGKIIGSIKIVSLSPFGTDVDHPEQRPPNKGIQLEKFGNDMHLNTQKLLIKSILLFKQGDALDFFRLKDSERLLRRLPFLRDSRINIQKGNTGNDTIDVIVVAQDLWSIFIQVDPSYPLPIAYGDNNLLGMGQQLKISDRYQPTSPVRDAREIYYQAPPIGNTYIVSSFRYVMKPENNQSRVLNISKGLVSAITKWAYGIELSHNDQQFVTYNRADTTYTYYPVTYQNFDSWLIRSFSLHPKKKFNEHDPRLLTGVRYYKRNYLERPALPYDTSLQYGNYDQIIGLVGISKRRYIKETYFYKLGRTEDVPVGYNLNIQIGYNFYEFYRYWYGSMSCSWGNFIYKRWYMDYSVQFGTQFDATHAYKPVLNLSTRVISRKFTPGLWLIRNYTTALMVLGQDLFYRQQTNLNTNGAMFGNNAGIYRNNGRISLSNQIAMVSPLRIIGFRFVPVIFAAVGFHSTAEKSFDFSKPYQTYGINLYIRNDRFVTGSFSLGIGFYYLKENIDGWNPAFNPSGTLNDQFYDLVPSKPDPIIFN